MSKTKGKTMKRKQLWSCTLEHLISVLIIVVICVQVYTVVYLNRCLGDWKGASFRAYDGFCGSYFYRDTFTRARTGWVFQLDNGERCFIPCDVCNRDNFQIDAIAANPSAPVNICIMPSTFLRFDNMIVSMRIHEEELVSQNAMYDYLKDQKSGCVVVISLEVLLLLFLLPGQIISDIELYQEHQRGKKRNRAKSNKSN